MTTGIIETEDGWMDGAEPFLMMTPRKTNEVVSFNHPCIAWSAPQLLLKKTQSEKKNIIFMAIKENR